MKEGDWTGISEWIKEVKGVEENNSEVDLIIKGIEDSIGLIE